LEQSVTEALAEVNAKRAISEARRILYLIIRRNYI
jgi:hypothetical protein